MDQWHHKLVWKGHIMIFWKTTLKSSLSKTKGSCEGIDYESKHIMVDVAVEITAQRFFERNTVYFPVGVVHRWIGCHLCSQKIPICTEKQSCEQFGGIRDYKSYAIFVYWILASYKEMVVSSLWGQLRLLRESH